MAKPRKGKQTKRRGVVDLVIREPRSPSVSVSRRQSGGGVGGDSVNSGGATRRQYTII